MGKLENGILGKSRGKVGPVITANWKSLNVVKAYFKPSNPRTEPQQTQRNKFTVSVELTRSVLTTVVKPVWDKLSNTMSGYNLFIQSLLTTMDSNNHPTPATLISKGTLLSTTITNATFGENQIHIEFYNNSGQGNAKGSDKISLVVYDKSKKAFIYAQDLLNQRSEGEINLEIESGHTASNLICWIYFSQDTDMGKIYSDSLGTTLEPA